MKADLFFVSVTRQEYSRQRGHPPPLIGNQCIEPGSQEISGFEDRLLDATGKVVIARVADYPRRKRVLLVAQ